MTGATAVRRWGEGRAGLVMPLILAAFATYLLVGQLTMQVAPDADLPGPRFFPAIVVAALYVLAAIQAVGLLRTPRPQPAADDASETPGARWHSDWPRLAWAAGGFVAFVLLLDPAGWILSAGLLFWCMTRALGSTRPLRDVLVALTFSSVLYLVFAGLLSVNLPSGLILGGGA